MMTLNKLRTMLAAEIFKHDNSQGLTVRLDYNALIVTVSLDNEVQAVYDFSNLDVPEFLERQGELWQKCIDLRFVMAKKRLDELTKKEQKRMAMQCREALNSTTFKVSKKHLHLYKNEGTVFEEHSQIDITPATKADLEQIEATKSGIERTAAVIDLFESQVTTY